MKPPKPRAGAPGALSGSPAEFFRKEIEAAEAEGVSREDMTLRLTLGDVSKLKRDQRLAIDDISFSAGAMRLFGVKVKAGGIVTSVLEVGGDGSLVEP